VLAAGSLAVPASPLHARSCPRVGAVRMVDGVRFTCRRQGRSRSWVRSATAGSTGAAAYAPPSVGSGPLDACRLPDRSAERLRFGNLHAGFPPLTHNLGLGGTFTVAFVPVDFADLHGEPQPVRRATDQMRLFSDWWAMVSGGAARFDWRVHDGWVRLPGRSTDYAIARSGADDTRIADAALAAADPVFDFGGVSVVYFMLPAGQKILGESVQGFRHTRYRFDTAEGPIENYALPGAFFDASNRTYWSYWAHETGHMFPMPDLYLHSAQWGRGEPLAVPGGPFSGFDLMSNQDGPSRTLSTWLRFLQGWLRDEQVWCAPAGPVSSRVTLVPVDAGLPGVKSAMVPIGETSMVVVEARRPNPRFDCESPNRSGTIVYLVDSTLGTGEGQQQLVAPPGRGLVSPTSCAAPWQLDAVMRPGDSVVAGGVTVRVEATGTWDVVTITR
jgi:M6 family metalloprotease-like protein